MANRPSNYVNWVSDGDPSKQVQPPQSQLDSGWIAGEPPVAQFMNFLFRSLDQWVQYLDQQAGKSASAPAIQNSARLINSGTWAFAAATNTLSWSTSFNLAYPGLPDAANVVSGPGSVTLADGQAAYVNVNLPSSIAGTVTQGSNQLINLATTQGIAVGQSINGPGVPSNATVQSLSGNTVTMSQNATASQSAQPFTFYVSAPLTLQVANMATLVANPNTVLLARRFGNVVGFGVNTVEAVLRDGESKTVRNGGYALIQSAPAGAALSDRQALYLSTGSGGRTQGAVYPCEASATGGATRTQFVGFALGAATAGASVTFVAGGIMGGFSGLTPGTQYYVDPGTPGAITATKTTTSGQYAVAVGVALTATTICIAPPGGMVLERPTDLALSGTLTAQTLAAFNGSMLQMAAGQSFSPTTDGSGDLGALTKSWNNVFGKVGFFPLSYLTKIMSVSGADHFIEKNLLPWLPAGSQAANNGQTLGTVANFFARMVADTMNTQHIVPITGTSTDTPTLLPNGPSANLGSSAAPYPKAYCGELHPATGFNQTPYLSSYTATTAALGGAATYQYAVMCIAPGATAAFGQTAAFRFWSGGFLRGISGYVSNNNSNVTATINAQLTVNGNAVSYTLASNVQNTFSAAFPEGQFPLGDVGTSILFSFTVNATRGAALVSYLMPSIQVI